MSQQIVLAARSSSSKHSSTHSSTSKTSSGKTSKTGTYKTGTSTGTNYTNGYGKTHHGAGGSAIWFVIMAIVAVFVVFLGVKFFRGKRAA